MQFGGERYKIESIKKGDVIGVENKEPLASEIYQDLKATIKFKEKCIAWLCVIIGVLIVALAATNIWHIYQWSQFETVTVDSGEGGYANYVGGENAGGIYNGEGHGSESPQGQ